MPDGGHVAGLLAAAGQGLRLAAGPKAFVTVGGRTLLEWAVLGLEAVCDEVIVAVPGPDLERARALVPGATVMAGGASRQETVARLAAATTAELVLVHDAARPFLPVEVAQRVVEATVRHGAATAARALADTVVDMTSGVTLDRDRLRAVQTPQGFQRALLVRAHHEAATQAAVATDDAALVRRLGVEVAWVEGSPLLTKITTPDDLPLAEALCRLWLEARERTRPT